MLGDDHIQKLLKNLTQERLASQPIATSVDPDDLEMADDPRAQFTLALKKKRRTMMMKKLLEQGGFGDLSRIVSVREK